MRSNLSPDLTQLMVTSEVARFPALAALYFEFFNFVRL
jgi:hypothetical protein